MSDITTTTTKRKAGRPKLTEEEKLARKQAKENNIKNKNNDSSESKEKEYKDTRTDVAETAVTHVSGDDFCRFYSTEVWGRNFIKKMLEEHPEECKPLLWDDGVCVEITLPFQSIKYIRWPTKREMTEEQQEAARERAKKMREVRLGKKDNKEE